MIDAVHSVCAEPIEASFSFEEGQGFDKLSPSGCL
jgi:hypothetical protein